jgi:hypothetical protein
VLNTLHTLPEPARQAIVASLPASGRAAAAELARAGGQSAPPAENQRHQRASENEADDIGGPSWPDRRDEEQPEGSQTLIDRLMGPRRGRRPRDKK